MPKIQIFDTTLRDGEQSPGVNLNKLEKLEIAKQLERFGVDRMEVGFPASSQGDFEAVKMIADTIKDTSVIGLARTNKSDIDRAWEALKGAEHPAIHVFVATSPIHMEYKLHKTPEEVIDLSVEMVRYASERFAHVQWSAEDASRSELPFLAKIIEKVIDAGATVINLPDTVGYATPDEYGAMFKYMIDHVPNIEQAILSCHCHDDLGLATANTIAAVKNGARQVEGTINGIGERAGNVALEEVAAAFHVRKDNYSIETNLLLKEIKRTSDLVSKLTGMQIQANKAVVGKNAFAHESGIHQDGVLKNPLTYEIMTPETIGLQSNSLYLGKHSGRHAFKDKIESMGYELSEERLTEAFEKFKRLTDRKKDVTDDDLFTLITEVQTDTVAIEKYELENYQISFGTEGVPTATVTLKTPDNQILENTQTANGSVEALYKTLDSLVNEDVELVDFNLSSVGSGSDALAESHIQMIINGEEINGRGTDQDVVRSSANAYLDALNRYIVQMNINNEKNKV